MSTWRQAVIVSARFADSVAAPVDETRATVAVPRPQRTERASARSAPVPATGPGSPVFSASFRAVPRVPLYLLAGTRQEQLERIDSHLDWGRRAIDADREEVERLRRQSADDGVRRRLRQAFDERKANYETWRRQLLDLKKKAQRAG